MLYICYMFIYSRSTKKPPARMVDGTFDLSVAFWILKGHNSGNTKTKTTSVGVVSSGSLNQIECKSKEQLHYHSSTDHPTCQNWRFVLISKA